MKHIYVVAAIITHNKKVLCMQRPAGKYPYTDLKFEFPGGKIEPGETHVQALMRELNEEMAFRVNITEDDYFMTVEYEYPDFKITMYSYLCPVQDTHFVRKEHVDSKWLPVNRLQELDWAAADQPIVNELMKRGLP